MRPTEPSAADGVRCAMQLLVDAWSEGGPESRLPVGEGSVNLQALVLRALTLISRWTCAQWGCEAGWWADAEGGLKERRLAGLKRLSCGDQGQSEPDIIDAAARERVWHWVSLTCERARQQADDFEVLVAAFENALQIVAEVRDGFVTLRFGKANTAHTRRKSGSYYTPRRIVDLVLDQTLERTLDEREVHDGEFVSPLRVLDPACGAGLFLVSAAKRITARRVAHLEGAEKAAAHAAAFARTVRENIAGVDSNPLAIEWCRLWLWSCAGDYSLDIATFAPGLRVGNAIVGAPRDYWRGAPKEAWKPTAGDDKAEARRLKSQHQAAISRQPLTAEPESPAARELLADGWCAAFLWPKVSSGTSSEAPFAPAYLGLLNDVSPAATPRASESIGVSRSAETARSLRRRYGFFHWSLEFPRDLQAGGFDVVVGNPPWIAHAGRASQGLEPHLKQYFLCNYTSFNGYPTTHGLFVERAASLLKIGGRLGFVLPASVSELGGYEATRSAHDRLCDFDADLTDFGEGCFPGVTQPCMGLVSRRREGGRSDGKVGAPWPMSREDLGELGGALLSRLASMPVLEANLFGERGVQTDQRMKPHLSAGTEPHGRFTTPVREGADIREFFVGEPRLWADWPALGRQARAVDEYAAVRFVVRQTASFPIAALYDGLPFRNSLLAGFGSEQWPPEALVGLLNSSVVRWHHYMRHRDARQPVLPQVKVGHLRAIPRPLHVDAECKRTLCGLAASATAGETTPAQRVELDRLVETMYGLSAAEAELVRAWAEPMVGKARRLASPGLPAQG